MDRLILGILAGCFCLSAKGQSDVYFQTGFDGGVIPQGITLIDNDENPVNSTDYRNVVFTGDWSANEIDVDNNYAAFSLSRGLYDFAADNWMILPAMKIEDAAACLRWDAKSVHNDFRESYKVMISTDRDNLSSYKELFSTDNENYMWTTRVVPLSEYAGQEVNIAFVCTSNNRFILAIDNIYAGVPEKHAFIADDNSLRFSGDTGTAPVKGILVNAGQNVEVAGINCVYDGGTLTMDMDGGLFTTGEEKEYMFDLPVSVEQVSHYSIEVETASGDVVPVYSDSVVCSYFPRTLFVEKGTGTWCGNCPPGNVFSNKLKERFGEQAIVVESHFRDELNCKNYSSQLARWLQSFPSFIYDRNIESLQTGVYDQTKVEKEVLSPVTALVELSADPVDYNSNVLNLHTTSHFAVDYDNVKDIYRVGYAIYEKEVEATGETVQNNGQSTSPLYGEFYYLPAYIPEYMHTYHNVAREGGVAFAGVEQSLPEQIEAGGIYESSYSLAIPEELVGKEDLFVMAYVVNSVSGLVLNATKADITFKGGIAAAGNDSAGGIVVTARGAGEFDVQFADASSSYRAELISLDGCVMEAVSGNAGDGTARLSFSSPAGLYLLRVMQAGNTVVKKISIK